MSAGTKTPAPGERSSQGRMVMDRELLEWAAKAAGYEIEWGIVEEGKVLQPPTLAFKRDRYGMRWNWNPLTDDGDALRLAVKLGIQSCWFASLGYAIAFLVPPVKSVIEIHEYGTEPYAATRRAITRASAEIGKATASAGEGGKA